MMLAPLSSNTYQPVRANSNANSSSETEAAKEQPRQGQSQDKLATQIVDGLVSNPEFTKQAMRRVGRGDELTISVNGEDVVKIKSEGPSIAQKMIKGVQLGITAAANEVSQVVESDPAFSFRMAAMGVKTQVFNGIDTGLQEMAEKAWLPMLRGAALALDVKKGIETFKNKDASNVDKIIEGGHVVTDVVGFVGALGYQLLPSLKDQAGLLTAIGFAGDIVSYSYRALQFLRERGQVSATIEDKPGQNQQPPQTAFIAPSNQSQSIAKAFQA